MERITGTNLDYLYDRDANTKNFVTTNRFYADYGTVTRFRNRIGKVEGRDGYGTKYPIGLNSMVMEADILFTNLDQGEAGILISALQAKLAEDGEDVGSIRIGYNNNASLDTGTYTGMFLNLSAASGDLIYNKISGFYIADYEDVHRENFIHDIKLKVITNADSPFINYYGVYANSTGITGWTTATSYAQNDIVYYDGDIDERNNFYYCISGHTSSSSNHPTGASSAWTQAFQWSPDFSATYQEPADREIETFTHGLINRIKLNKNSQVLNMNLMFNNRSDKEARAILHYLENRMGHRKFNFTVSGIYRSKKYFTCPEWEHEMVYKDVNNISIAIEEEINVAPVRSIDNSDYINADVGAYATNVVSEGCQATDAAALQAADEFITALKQTPSGFSTTIYDQIYHLWCPLCDGTGGVHVALIDNFQSGGNGSHLIMSTVVAHPMDTYSLTGGFTFNGNGGFLNGIYEDDSAGGVGKYSNSMGAFVMNEDTTSSRWLGGNNVQNDFWLGQSNSTTMSRTFHKNGYSTSPVTITGLVMGTQFSGNSDGRSSKLFIGTGEEDSDDGFNLPHAGESSHSYAYGGTSQSAIAMDGNKTTGTFGLMFWGKGAFTGQMQQDFVSAVNTFMTALGRM
jgi:hypothetical protein